MDCLLCASRFANPLSQDFVDSDEDDGFESRPRESAAIAIQAGWRRKHRRMQLITVKIPQGEGKLGLVFHKGSSPPIVSAVHDDGLVAQADMQPSVGMTLEKVGTTFIGAMSYGRFALPFAPCHLRALPLWVVDLNLAERLF